MRLNKNYDFIYRTSIYCLFPLKFNFMNFKPSVTCCFNVNMRAKSSGRQSEILQCHGASTSRRVFSNKIAINIYIQKYMFVGHVALTEGS